MDPTLLFILILVGGAIFAAVQKQAVTQPGRALHQKFVDLGTLTGKTKAEIIEVVGNPTSISVLGENQTLLQWQATGCHMALRFTGEMCEGIIHQHLSAWFWRGEK